MKKGEVVAVFIGPQKREPMIEVKQAKALLGQGLEGDRYATGNGNYNQNNVGARQVTLMAVRHFHDSGFTFAQSRRNIFTAGVELNNLITKEFRIGRALFLGERYCEPCDVPGTNFKEHFHDRGGIIAQVHRTGVFNVGDAIRDNFWTFYDRVALKEAQTLEETLRIAIIILERMKRTGKKIIQICGPMTTGGFNDYEKNMVLFRQVMENAHLDEQFLVFDQDAFSDVFDRINKARHDYNDGRDYWHDLINKFYGELFRRGYFGGTAWIRDWQSSMGCLGERKFAEAHNIEMFDCPECWYE